ncbi:hypothetical protein ASPWEDRAFT_47133 [Aspergillus wentii DTO 134E9]|uniref:F-box domain-containing protein n=1 Tax=Aspergillus wentii DTO 134E9 TaxID=1073089 RepID=A0A1L9RZD1_ASPWE|nr:uncharacterized protein ASPWEDRAFT_47133 [Aspergillus wentii DTO 134E9]KAI9932689.1 hypothetical protein MW887_008938 [Aspergillus wentii]OJJ40262.1 hypothetical protein ASPWEDRAFT_47133 [Aspergillus wentii DTO 134E9]
MEQLPVEIFSKIIDYLTPREQVQLQSVSKRLFALARDNILWRLHCYEETWIASEAHRPIAKALGSQIGLNSAATTSLSSLGQASLISLIQPSHTHQDEDEYDEDQLPVSSLGERSRGAAAWDPSYEGEEVDWYSEYIARHGPISFDWLQRPFSRGPQSSKRNAHEVKGMGLLKDWSSARQNKVVAPLNDGSVCIWDLNHSHYAASQATKGKVLGISAPGILTADLSRRRENSTSKAALDFINLGECVSVDSLRQRAFLAVGNALNEVDLETLRVVSQQRYPWSVFALSQETDYSVPLTLATTLSLHIYDSRLSVSEEEEAISLRCEKAAASPFASDSRLFTHPDSPILQLQPNGLPPQRIRSPEPSEKGANYAPLFQPGPLALLHPPAPHVNTILLAGRFPSILCYDRRYFPRLQNTVHAGSRLCGLAPVPAPRFPVFSESTWSDSHSVAACGEYNGRGSLEVYSLTSPAYGCKKSPSDSSSSLYSAYKNRQSAASSKLLSVGSHGTRLVYSDAEGNIKWVERDGRTEVRRWNINTHETDTGSNRNSQSNDDYGSTGLWRSLSRSQENSEVARKVLPTGGNLTGNELLIWTGERIGRLKFSGHTRPADEVEEDDMSIDGELDSDACEEMRQRKREERRKEREYTDMMRRVLERQADEVRWTRGFGLS